MVNLRFVIAILPVAVPAAVTVAASGSSSSSSPEALRTLTRLCKGCFEEPVEVDYFSSFGVGREPPRVKWSDLEDGGKADFRKLADAGKVLIIEDATSGMALDGWTCSKMAEEFPDGKMRREYDWVKNPQDRNLQTMGSLSWMGEKIEGEDARDRLDQDAFAPRYAPFYWGVREYGNGQVGSKAVVNKLRKLVESSVPTFMDPKNGASLFENAEFWLGTNQTGARAHMDSHCIATLSFVLSGERRWRIGPVPRMPKGGGRSKNDDVFFDDGVAYALKWKPMFEFTLKQGEAVLFPPGWIHETLNTHVDCTVALTTQFDIPKPVKYYRTFYQRLRRVGDLNPCWKSMKSWASLGGVKTDKQMPATDKAATAKATEIYESRKGSLSPQEISFHDINEDGTVNADEFAANFRSWVATEAAIRQEKATRKLKPDMDLTPPGEKTAPREDL
mmetsp:Transcript_52130/g.110938  ORF Transcript_52130/g.110938 Transcript_52130/m.110938 type:complete len:446 (+) Transcript_52130:47-1384(+)